MNRVQFKIIHQKNVYLLYHTDGPALKCPSNSRTANNWDHDNLFPKSSQECVLLCIYIELYVQFYGIYNPYMTL